MYTKYLDLFATLTGGLGILTAVVAGLARFMGFYYLGGFASITLLNGAIALMAISCVLQLRLLRDR